MTYQGREENKAMAMMNQIEESYKDPEDAEYNEALHAMINKAFAMVKEQVNGNWYNFNGQDQLIAAVEKVFDMTANCQSYDEIYAICK